jgi:RNA polymerase sigma-54 factor
MALRPGLVQRQTQRLALTPGMRRSLELLRMPAVDLAADLVRMAAENPFLLVDWPRGSGGGRAYEVALETVAARPSLVESLRGQLGLMALPARVADLAAYLAGDLRDDGYLDTPLDDYAQRLGADPRDLMAALAALQACEPAGVGARTLAECLDLQMRDRGVPAALIKRVLAHLPLFGGPDVGALAAALDLPVDAVRALAGLVRTLRAQPVPEGEGQAPRVLRADLVVTRDNCGALVVAPVRQSLPRVRLNAALRARGGGFAKDAQREAEALIAALAQRQSTLVRIGTALAEAQHRFFALGPEHLAPLSRAALAARLDLHPSTVGRAVAGKALDHQGRLYPLSMFFSAALGGEDGQGGPVSAFATQQALARIVAHENPEAPLSDAMICERLRAEGVDITRRTVAKYRGCMRIPSSYERHRRHGQRSMQPHTVAAKTIFIP